MESSQSLPREVRVVAVHAAYGRAMLSAHSLERRLADLLEAHIAGQNLDNECFRSEAKRVRKMTLSRLIDGFSAAYAPPMPLQERLGDMLTIRNQLTHRIAETILSELHEEGWEERVAELLIEWHLLLKETNDLLQPYVESYFQEHGIDRVDINGIVKKLYPGAARGA